MGDATTGLGATSHHSWRALWALSPVSSCCIHLWQAPALETQGMQGLGWGGHYQEVRRVIRVTNPNPNPS